MKIFNDGVRVKIWAGAIGVHHTATTDVTWDGPAAVAAMPNTASALKFCHAWVDSSAGVDPDAKSSYKLPHHKADHAPANLNGVRNALARLSGANIPETDKAAVKSHLQAHLDDADEKGNHVKHLPKAIAERWSVIKPQLGNRAGLRVVKAGTLTNGYMAGNPEIYLYEEVGMWGIGAQEFVDALRSIGSNPVDVHVNSPGGEVFDGIAIYNALLNHPAPVNVFIDGLAASAASFIAMAGTTVNAAKTSTLMIHDAIGLAFGNANDMRELADLLDKSSDNIASIYGDKAGGTVADWRTRMAAETWYTAEEAKDAGLVDAIITPQRAGQPAPDPLENSAMAVVFRYRNRTDAPAPPAVQPPAAIEEPDRDLDFAALVKGAFQ